MEQNTNETSEHVSKKARKRNKKRKVQNNDETIENASETAEPKNDSAVIKDIQVTTANKSKRKTKPQDVSNKANEKIEDNVQTLPVKKKLKINKKHFNEDEAEVKDEDIDKFCDELDEKDNEQYENWVKLFEANFMSKKKKT